MAHSQILNSGSAIPSYERFCLVLDDGNNTKVFRFVAEECPGCNNTYEKEYYTNEIGDQIATPDITNATQCVDCEAATPEGLKTNWG